MYPLLAADKLEKLMVVETGLIEPGQIDMTQWLGGRYCPLYNKGKILSSARKDDLPLMVTFMKACKSAGATAIGQGNGYMSNTGIHVDIALIGINF